MRQDDIKDLDVPIQKRGNGGYIKLSLWFLREPFLWFLGNDGYNHENRPPGFFLTTRTVPLVSSEDWVCPLCGATKEEFEKQGEAATSAESKSVSVIELSSDMRELSPLEMSALCTNLARGCEKQYKPEEASLFTKLAEYFKKAAAPAKEPEFDNLLELIENDLNEGFPNANAIASSEKDRGAMRALVWSEKVTRILKSILSRYEKEGDALLDNTGVYVCTICGYIYIGDTIPDICPVCKVPNWKFEKIEGR